MKDQTGAAQVGKLDDYRELFTYDLVPQMSLSFQI